MFQILFTDTSFSQDKWALGNSKGTRFRGRLLDSQVFLFPFLTFIPISSSCKFEVILTRSSIFAPIFLLRIKSCTLWVQKLRMLRLWWSKGRSKMIFRLWLLITLYTRQMKEARNVPSPYSVRESSKKRLIFVGDVKNAECFSDLWVLRNYFLILFINFRSKERCSKVDLGCNIHGANVFLCFKNNFP